MVFQNDCGDEGWLDIPEREPCALRGSEFVSSVISLRGGARDEKVLEQLLMGNVPLFMRSLCPIFLTSVGLSGEHRSATFWATPDYLCIGDDDDYVRFPMNPLTAQKVADAYGGFLPTRRVVNAIFTRSDTKLVAKTLLAGNHMRSTRYVAEHNALIQAQLAGASPGALVAGHKKDIILCQRLFSDAAGRPWDEGHSPRVAIYGWARRLRFC